MPTLDHKSLNLTEAQTKFLMNVAASEVPLRCERGGNTFAMDRGTLYCEHSKKNESDPSAGNYICLAPGNGMGHPCILNKIINLMYKAIRQE